MLQVLRNLRVWLQLFNKSSNMESHTCYSPTPIASEANDNQRHAVHKQFSGVLKKLKSKDHPCSFLDDRWVLVIKNAAEQQPLVPTQLVHVGGVPDQSRKIHQYTSVISTGTERSPFSVHPNCLLVNIGWCQVWCWKIPSFVGEISDLLR